MIIITFFLSAYRNVNNVGFALKAVLQKAQEEGLLVFFRCAEMNKIKTLVLEFIS
jgi:hypothetical protein